MGIKTNQQKRCKISRLDPNVVAVLQESTAIPFGIIFSTA